jgi:3-hydroxyisobutyrate dehydrogenase-like beta-hydroxyacid dehydrogenase
MKRVGVIGLGDMGSGLAKNLIANGFETVGFDLSEPRMAAFAALGGHGAADAAAVGAKADPVFVMVMTGDEAKAAILGDGLVATLKPGSIVILTATVHAQEARDIAHALGSKGIALIDAPVSGGYSGAQAGTLTMMAAAPDDVLERARPVMTAVSGSIHRVGTEPGMGQIVKACLQAMIGSIYTATFEASVLAAKAGIGGQVFHDVVSTSSAGCHAASNSLDKIIDRSFEHSGSRIATMHKDLAIALELARQLGVPLFTAGTAMQLFEAGKTRFPDGDNWAVTRVLEEIAGAALTR